ncbi:hypothetical protein [Streptomyces sp. NPDC002990]
MSADVRPIAESELPERLRTVNLGFLRPAEVTPSDVAQRAEYNDLTRIQGAFDTGTGTGSGTGRCVAAFRAALGRVAQEWPGALALAVFRTARRPWCPDVF